MYIYIYIYIYINIFVQTSVMYSYLKRLPLVWV